MDLPLALQQTLPMIAAAMRDARDDWWIVGSAAVALHGARAVAVRDVDVLLSVADARHVLPEIGVALTPGIADSRFRSDFYCHWDAPPVPVDFMAGFHVYGTPLVPATRHSIMAGDAMLFMPSRDELLAMLRHFDRPKDRERARLLAVTPSTIGP